MITKRIQNMTPSATVALNSRVTELKANGMDIIALNVGEPDFGTPDHICRAACEALEQQKTKYTAVSGIPALREAICEKLRADNGAVYTPAQISVGVGAKQPLLNAVLALCEAGDEVIIPTPCWVSYIEMVKLAEATPVLVPDREADGFALNLEGIRAAITPRTKAIMLNTPNNPTGAVYTEAQLRELADLAYAHDFYIISDEVYEKLVYDGAKHVCAASLSKEAWERTVVINGFSKAYAMTGWRLGYAAAPTKIIQGMNSLQSHMTSCTSSIAQYAGVEALRGPQEPLETMRRAFDARRRFLLERLNAMDGVTCVNASGAFYLLPNVSAYFGSTFEGKPIRDSFDLAEYLLDQAHVAVVPGAAFEAPENLRIAYSNSMENLTRGMDQMEAALAKLRRP